MLDFADDGWPVAVPGGRGATGWFPMADLGGEISPERWAEHFTDSDGDVIIDPTTPPGSRIADPDPRRVSARTLQ